MSSSAKSVDENSHILVCEGKRGEEDRTKQAQIQAAGGLDPHNMKLRWNGVINNDSRQNPEKVRRRNLLKCSLALYLVKVGRDNGSQTVEGILKVLNYEYFNLEEFVEKVKSLEDCSKLGKILMDNTK